jgi:VWFA-related protein
LIVPLALALTVSALGQQAPPTFKSAVDLVTLDIRVVDGQGRFVDDVSQDDLKIFEDGREQTISSFERVQMPLGAAGTRSAADDALSLRQAAAPRPAPAGARADVATNDGPAPALTEGRLYVLVMDDLRTNPSYASDVRAQAREFVERHFTSSDRGVVLTTSGWQRATPEFTSDRQRLLESIGQFEGDAGFVASAMCEAGGANAGQCTVRNDVAALRALTVVARWLAPIVGQRKTVLLFSEGLSIDQASFFLGPDPTVVDASAPQADTGSGDPTRSPGGVRLGQKIGAADAAFRAILPELQTAEGAAARANVAVYPLDPRRHPEASFDRIVAESSSYYLLGYTPTNEKHDGTFRKIDVRTRRPGLRVQARTGYTARNDAARSSTAPDVSAALSEMLAAPIAMSGLPMRVTAPAFAGSDSKASVEVIVDIAGRDLLAASAASGGKGSLALLMTVADASGRVEARERGSLDINLSEATRGQLAERGVRLISRLEVAPGRYVLRVAGVDEGGAARGTIQYDLDVPDFSRGALSMSDLAIALASEADPPITGSDKTWSERFTRAPTTARTFSAADELLVVGEIYGSGMALDSVDATTTVRSASGEVVFDHRSELQQRTDRASTLIHSTRVPLQGLDPGDYVLAVESTAGSDGAPVSRELPFTVVR